MDNAVISHDVSSCNFSFVDHDATRGGDGQFRALHGFDFARFYVSGHHFTCDHMVRKYSSELGLVFEQRIQVGFRNLGKGCICG